MNELKRYNLEFLYEKLKPVEITPDNIWTLDDDMLHRIGLTKIEQLKYKKALEKFNKHSIMPMDEMLMTELKKFNLQLLYDKFREGKITSDIIWYLDEDILKECDLTKVEKLRYQKAAAKFKEKLSN